MKPGSKPASLTALAAPVSPLPENGTDHPHVGHGSRGGWREAREEIQDLLAVWSRFHCVICPAFPDTSSSRSHEGLRKKKTQWKSWAKVRVRLKDPVPSFRLLGSVLPQVEKPDAGGGLLDRHCDQVRGDIGDKDVLNQAAGGLPVLAGLDGHRHVLTHSWEGS